MIVTDQGNVMVDIQGEITRLEELVRALRRLAAGEAPSAEELEAAPLIDRWGACIRASPCLAGEIHGHPRCRGPLSVTSEVFVIAPTMGWAHTFNRLYRLGRHHGVSARQ